MIRRISDSSGQRLIVIGLDGASFNYLDPILEKGILPNFIRFFKSGVRSDCISTIPPLTPPAWSTMLTGVNPGKHGIFDFIQPDESGGFRMIDANYRRRKSFIDYAEASDIRAISLLVPYTFPPDPDTKGLIVSGLGTPSGESDFIRPHSFRDVILAKFPFLKEVDPTKGQSLDTLHESLRAHTEKTAELARFAMDQLPDWGILFTAFQATDLIPHFYSKFFDQNHPDYVTGDSVPMAYRESLQRIYRTIDPFLGDCLDIIEKEGGWVILVSDHGSAPLMGAIGKDAFLARWLEDSGWLVTSGAAGQVGSAARVQAGSIANRLLYLAKRYTPHGMRDAVNRMLGKRKEKFVDTLTAIPFMRGIVWDKTRAFCAPGGYGVGLYINRQGDFPHGIVPHGAEYHRLRDEIKSGLESLEIEHGVPLFNRVIPREDALWGTAVNLAPDLLLLWREDPKLKENNYRLADGRKLDPPEARPGTRLTWCGTHRMEGLFGISGIGVRTNEVLHAIPNLADIYPTIHLIAGLPVPSDIDGKVISGAFNMDFPDSNKPIAGPPEQSVEGIHAPVSSEDSEKMIDLLEGLGYLN